MPPKKKTTKRRTTRKAGPAAAAPVVQRFVFSPNARCMLDEIAELLLAALNAPGRFVYRLVKRGASFDGVELGVNAPSRAEADAKALASAKRLKARVRFVREQKGT